MKKFRLTNKNRNLPNKNVEVIYECKVITDCGNSSLIKI